MEYGQSLPTTSYTDESWSCTHPTPSSERKDILYLKETDGFVQFGLELIDVFESVGNIRAFMQVCTLNWSYEALRHPVLYQKIIFQESVRQSDVLGSNTSLSTVLAEHCGRLWVIPNMPKMSQNKAWSDSQSRFPNIFKKPPAGKLKVSRIAPVHERVMLLHGPWNR